jgi:GT2 family glycosyltransferase
MTAIDALIVNWNGARYLPGCVEALTRSTVPVHVIVVDNASTDGSADYIRAHHPNVELLELSENRGYAGGANAGLRATSSEYAVILNPDVVLAADHLEVLIARFDANPTLGIAQGRLHQVSPDDYDAGRYSPTAPLDSAAHRASRTRMVYDRGQGEPSEGHYESGESVFSACGAAIMLRRSMLEDLAPDGEYFDESFFAYKEDIDLCWRARLLGWDVQYVPEAVGWHVRGWSGRRAPAPHELPYEARYHSFKNHYLLLLKNESIRNLVLDLPWVVGWELLRQGHVLLRDRSLYRVYPELLRLLPEVLRKRRDLMRRRRVSPAEMRRWFGRVEDFASAGAVGTRPGALAESGHSPEL